MVIPWYVYLLAVLVCTLVVVANRSHKVLMQELQQALTPDAWINEGILCFALCKRHMWASDTIVQHALQSLVLKNLVQQRIDVHDRREYRLSPSQPS